MPVAPDKGRIRTIEDLENRLLAFSARKIEIRVWFPGETYGGWVVRPLNAAECARLSRAGIGAGQEGQALDVVIVTKAQCH